MRVSRLCYPIFLLISRKKLRTVSFPARGRDLSHRWRCFNLPRLWLINFQPPNEKRQLILILVHAKTLIFYFEEVNQTIAIVDEGQKRNNI